MRRRKLLRAAGILRAALLAAVLAGVQSGPAWAADPQPVTVLIAYHSTTGNTEKMAQGVAEGARAVAGTTVVLKRVGDVEGRDLSSSDAVVVGSPVYFANMSGETKAFLDSWSLKFDLFRDRKMRDKVGAAFSTGGSVSAGKEFTILSILAAMLNNQMIVVSGADGLGASATTGPDSPGVDDKELASARDLGRRVAEVAAVVKRGSGR
jgi:NAD(P)H dehydrogenase (quinone)